MHQNPDQLRWEMSLDREKLIFFYDKKVSKTPINANIRRAFRIEFYNPINSKGWFNCGYQLRIQILYKKSLIYCFYFLRFPKLRSSNFRIFLNFGSVLFSSIENEYFQGDKEIIFAQNFKIYYPSELIDQK